MRSVLTIFILLCFFNSANAENLREIVKLEGTWKFTIGDDLNWSSPDYNDSGWDYVQVPREWEESGFEGYNGYAWYRKEFRYRQETNSNYLFLLAGYIDDVDEIYINGQLVGTTGKFPPLVETAYDIPRKYPIPVNLLIQDGVNVIAVRVFDDYHVGGIIRGSVGIYADEDNQLLEQDLSGYWDFNADNMASSHSPKMKEIQSGQIFVPAHWEVQGLHNYDGSATYKRNFKLKSGLKNQEELYLVLGYIDDLDKVYLNNQKIGSVTELSRRESEYYQTFRYYEIPADLLKTNGDNLLEVIVYDDWGLGGIYAGPVGITTEKKLSTLKKKQNKPKEKSIFDVLKEFWE